MSVRFYMDHQVPAAITAGLRRRGVDCVTAAEDGRSALDDPEILTRATELKRVLFTLDDDLLAIAAQWVATGTRFTGVVYAHQLEITIGQAVRDLELIANVYDPPDMESRVERVPL